MKNTFDEPRIEIIDFLEDIIITSGNNSSGLKDNGNGSYSLPEIPFN
ncbi:MAG: hypothetical protein IJH31_04530 [Erysipelotrichaceae bacterium]|nr:hypothetical protein [Erysipelotrichaceae bacterium]